MYADYGDINIESFMVYYERNMCHACCRIIPAGCSTGAILGQWHENGPDYMWNRASLTTKSCPRT